MNILVVPDRGRSVSSARPEAEIYISLARAGHNLTLCLDPESAYLPLYRQHNLDIVELPYGRKIEPGNVRTLHRLIKQKAIDVVYATTSRTIPNAVFACVGTAAKVAVYRGTTGGLYRSDPTNYLSVLNPRVDGVVCVSNAVRDHVRSRVRPAITPYVKTIYKGHDTGWYSKPATDLQEVGSAPELFNLLCIGSHRVSKGIPYLLQAAAELKDLAELRIILVGNNMDAEPYLSQIQASGMAERILLPGFRDDFPQLAKACDLMVLPSLREGLSRASLEAFANGTPVISADYDGATELIVDGENGYVVPMHDSQAIVEKVRYLYANRDELQRLSNNAIDSVKTRFSHAQTVAAMQSYFMELVASKEKA